MAEDGWSVSSVDAAEVSGVDEASWTSPTSNSLPVLSLMLKLREDVQRDKVSGVDDASWTSTSPTSDSLMGLELAIKRNTNIILVQSQ